MDIFSPQIISWLHKLRPNRFWLLFPRGDHHRVGLKWPDAVAWLCGSVLEPLYTRPKAERQGQQAQRLASYNRETTGSYLAPNNHVMLVFLLPRAALRVQGTALPRHPSALPFRHIDLLIAAPAVLLGRERA